MKKIILLSLVLLNTAAFSFAQNVAINADASLPNNSAMLDVKNPNKGMLIPRVALTGTNDIFTIPAPAISLLVYNTTAAGSGSNAVAAGYYYWTGAWTRLITNNDVSPAWLLTGNTGTVDGTNFIGTTNNAPFNVRVNNQKAGRIDAIGDGPGGNTFWGYQTGNVTTNGAFNAGIGYQALFSNTSGAYNAAIGNNSLRSNTTGNHNTGLGNFTDVSTGNLSNATAIGSGAIVNASNKVRIGNGGVFAIEGAAPYSQVSDARFKYNIKSDVPGLDFIKKLNPVTYYMDAEKLETFTKTGVLQDNRDGLASFDSQKENQELHTGFLAQDIEKAAASLGYKFDGVHVPENDKDYYSVAYSQFIMPLVKGMQEQQKMIESQNKKLQIQEEQIKKMNDKIEMLLQSIKTK